MEGNRLCAFVHSLSHALMGEIALDCGYPASALKEHIYALDGIGLVA
jgi:hypothetical protein